MDAKQISELSDDRLRLLTERAKSLPNEPSAQILLSLIEMEQEKRKQAKREHQKYPLRWTERDRVYEASVEDRIVAIIKKVDNHSMTRRDVYHAVIGDRFLGKFEKIKEAKEAVAREVLLLRQADLRS